MAFCFKRKESVRDAIRRLESERIGKALQALRHSRKPEAIHRVRKEIKKMRAILRLVRSQLPKEQYGKYSGWLKRAGELLSPTRDAFVRTRALQSLASRVKGRLAGHPFHDFHKFFAATYREEINAFAKQARAQKVDCLVRRLEGHIRHLEVRGKGWKALSWGFEDSYRRGRRAYRAFLDHASYEDLHEWRKRAKDLQYQMNLIRPIWPEQIDAAVHELETLTDALGEAHDLVLLDQAVTGHSLQVGNLADLRSLRVLIERRRTELVSVALGIGVRFYSQKSAQFRARLDLYWHNWRARKTAVPGRKQSPN